MAIYVVVVPAELKAAAEAASAQLAQASGESFSVALEPVAGGGISHWASVPNIVPLAAQSAIQGLAQSAPFAGTSYVQEVSPESIRDEFLEFISSLGLKEHQEAE